MANNDLGDFLRARRAGLTPEEIGLPVEFGAGRRVAGLRRGEVARLAGVSTEYYTRLEQGRARQPSEQVLHALCDALRFDDIERRHLFALAGTTAGRKDRDEHSSRLRPALRQVLPARSKPTGPAGHWSAHHAASPTTTPCSTRSEPGARPSRVRASATPIARATPSSPCWTRTGLPYTSCSARTRYAWSPPGADASRTASTPGRNSAAPPTPRRGEPRSPDVPSQMIRPLVGLLACGDQFS
ncbi:helix-turn-helix domain-containing protein [Streptomyces sp. STR69]|uniref:helix-turn-helix domain-containing protein n=1 Tax=Streptomyces sp. STR69 TaxID=1796942 RepID=UPI0021C58157|nr:transcriptional regulator [Streptomyces sp. STR69]